MDRCSTAGRPLCRQLWPGTRCAHEPAPKMLAHPLRREAIPSCTSSQHCWSAFVSAAFSTSSFTACQKCSTGAGACNAPSCAARRSPTSPRQPRRAAIGVPCMRSRDHRAREHSVVSRLALGGRCKACRTRISIRYPIVEILAARWQSQRSSPSARRQRRRGMRSVVDAAGADNDRRYSASPGRPHTAAGVVRPYRQSMGALHAARKRRHRGGCGVPRS